jgi:hypothetical protein
MRKVTVFMDLDTHDKIITISHDRNLRSSEVIREALRLGLQQMEQNGHTKPHKALKLALSYSIMTHSLIELFVQKSLVDGKELCHKNQDLVAPIIEQTLLEFDK